MFIFRDSAVKETNEFSKYLLRFRNFNGTYTLRKCEDKNQMVKAVWISD